jgi:hypothetical protein
MATDFTKGDTQIIVDLINERNAGLSLTPLLVTFGLPTLNATDARNTKVTVTAVPGSGYKNFKSLLYNRVELAVIPGARSIEFPKGDALKIADLIPEINARYQLNLTTNDFVDGDLPNFTGTPNEKLDFQLAANADSLVYIGSVTLKIIAEDLDLAVVIANPILDGLVYVQPVDPSLGG